MVEGVNIEGLFGVDYRCVIWVPCYWGKNIEVWLGDGY